MSSKFWKVVYHVSGVFSFSGVRPVWEVFYLHSNSWLAKTKREGQEIHRISPSVQPSTATSQAGLTTDPYCIFVMTWPTSDAGTHRTLVSKAILLIFYLFQEANLSPVLLLIHRFYILIFFSFLKYLFNFLSICLSPDLQKWVSSPSSLPFWILMKASNCLLFVSLEYPSIENKTWYHFTKSAPLPFYSTLDSRSYRFSRVPCEWGPSVFDSTWKYCHGINLYSLFPLPIFSSGSHLSLF